MSEIDLLNAVLNGGQLAFMVWLVMDMRRREAEVNAKIWALLEEMAHRRGIDASRFEHP